MGGSVKNFYIHLCCDSSLTETERKAVHRGAVKLTELFPECRVVDYRTAAWSGGFSGDRLAAGTENKRGQLNGSMILRRVPEAIRALPRPRAFILYTGRDLTLEKMKWCFGGASRDRRATVQSLYRLRALSPGERQRCIDRTMRHELGHIFGMAWDLKRENTEEHFGPHCVNPGCSMRQTGTLRELLACSLEEEQAGVYFCGQCRADRLRFLRDEGF